MCVLSYILEPLTMVNLEMGDSCVGDICALCVWGGGSHTHFLDNSDMIDAGKNYLGEIES